MAQAEPVESAAAVGVVEAPEHKPYVPAGSILPEFTLRAVLLGVFFGLVFGASTVYLGLKVGLTVSASIPIAVLAITVLRLFGRASILENNIVQTTGSAGESIAAGIVFTIPALLILGLDLDIMRTSLIGLTGGLLGVLLMIPLRRALIVKEHGVLPYPEGTACAEVLVVGEKGGADAKTVFMGFGVAFAYKYLMSGLKFWKDIPDKVLTGYQGSRIAAEISPELLGVGYIIGPRVASYMFGGGIIAALVLTPTIKFFGSGLQTNIFPAGAGELIGNMNAGQIFDRYVRYIAAGAVAAGGIISLLRSLPTIIHAFKAGVKDFRGGAGNDKAVANRVERDVPVSYAAIGVLALLTVVCLIPGFGVDPLSALMILIFGFFFVTVSSRICGQIGSTSNPISGMTIATLLFTSLIFLLVGRAGADERVIALTVGAIVCVAAANAGNTSQDLKTGFLVGATPAKQQIGLMIGAVTSAVVVGWTLLFLNSAGINILPRDYPSYFAPPQEIGEAWTTESEIKDGKSYRVLRLPVETDGGDGKTKIPAGKYLVDEQGQIHYLVNPGVGGIGERLSDERLAGLAGRTFVEGPGVKKSARMRGLDDQIYDTVVVSGEGVKDRTLLVDSTGAPKYEVLDAEGKLSAPKAALMGILVDGVLTRKLPWSLILIGAIIAVFLEIIGIQALPVAVGIYLPISTSATIFAGGLVRTVVTRLNRGGRKESLTEEETGKGVLLSSGFIAGGAIAGLFVAFSRVIIETVKHAPGKGEALLGIGGTSWISSGAWSNVFSLIIFAGLALFLFKVARRQSEIGKT
jgi:putative OPT family oligopeptide transporter